MVRLTALNWRTLRRATLSRIVRLLSQLQRVRGLGTQAALRPATELSQSPYHLRHTGGLAALSSHRTSSSFSGNFGLFPARQKALEPLSGRWE